MARTALLGLFALLLIATVAAVNFPFGLSPPSLRYPDVTDLGAWECGQLVTANVALENQGARPLLIHEIRTHCSCTGLERQMPDGQAVRLNSLSLSPRETQMLQCRFTASGRPGDEQHQLVFLRSNDPKQPEVALRFKIGPILGGIVTAPGAVLFGRVPENEIRQHEFDIWDLNRTPRSLIHAESSHPEVFSVQWKFSRVPLGNRVRGGFIWVK